MPTRRFWIAFILVIAIVLAGLVLIDSGLPAGEENTPNPTSPTAEAAQATGPVNAVLGDASYIARFGHRPGPGASETVRLRTHLAYVEQLLRARPTDHLTPEQRTARARHLDRLHDYWTRGRFPRNYAPESGRRPTFIDREGRLCAVGYLIAQSAGRAVAARINAAYKHAHVPDIDAPALAEWAEAAGFTIRELAMIQPAYECIDSDCTPDAGEKEMNRTAEIGVMALNGGAAVLNGVLAAQGRRSYMAAGAGLALGVTGLSLSLSDRANYSTSDALFAGAAVLTSAWNLTAPLQRRAEATASTSWIPDAHVAAVPVRGDTPKMGLSLQWDL